MSKFSERLKSLRKASDLSQQELADKIKMSKSSVNMYERGEREPGIETLETIADFFNVDMGYLLGKSSIPNAASRKRGLRSNVDLSSMSGNDVYMIPVYDCVSAGFGAKAEDYVVNFCPAIIHGGAGVEQYLYINVRGDSMSPLIDDGSRILVRKQSSVDSDSVGVVLIDGEEAVVKKIVYAPKGDWVDLISVNPYYPPRRFQGEEELSRLRVLGVVKGIFKQL